MPQSRKRKAGVKHSKQLKRRFMDQQNKQSEVPQRFLLPVPKWESKEMLEIRGDLLQAIDDNLSDAYAYQMETAKCLENCGKAFQAMMGHNLKNNKMQITYKWSDGTEATEDEIKAFQKQQEAVNKSKSNAGTTSPILGPEGQAIVYSDDAEGKPAENKADQDVETGKVISLNTGDEVRD